MKINLILLSNILRVNKNRKKYLFLINIGLFLALFAITSALITFHTETKIDKIEFELLEAHESRKEFDDLTKYFVEQRGVFFNLTNIEKNLTDLNVYIAGSILAEKIITVKDIYLPNLYLDFEGADFEYIREFYEKGGLLDDVELSVKEFYDRDDEILKDIISLGKELREYETFFKKDYSIYHKDLFLFDDLKIFDEQYDETINYFDSEIYKDYLKLVKAYKLLKDYFTALSTYIQDVSNTVDFSLLISNTKITELSKKESNYIVIAFAFQLLIFFIIQFFEIASIHNERKINAKRKIK